MPNKIETTVVMTPITGGQTLHINEHTGDTPKPDYSPAMIEYKQMRRQRFIAARDARDASHPEFDDMTFLEWYDKMKKMDDQYVPPRRSAQDTSINTGTVRDKDTSMIDFAKKYDFVPIATAYGEDDDQPSEDLAELGEDLVIKSFEIEQFDDTKAEEIYRSMIAFGTAMVEDTTYQPWENQKEVAADFKLGSMNANWTEHKKVGLPECHAKLWDLRKCYFGDIRKGLMNGPEGQPFFFTVEYEPYEKAKAIFGNFEQWKYVPKTVVFSQDVQQGVFRNGWTLRPLSLNYCEIIRYYDPIANEFSLSINDVDMLPIMEKDVTLPDGTKKTMVSGFPLTAISPSGGINFAKFDFERMINFTYSKGQPAKMRVSSDVENLIIKTFVWMFKQKARPTLGNKSGQVFGEEIYDPATVISQIRDGDLFPVFPEFQGASSSDFQMLELFKTELDKNSVERTSQGMDNPQQFDESATASLNNMKSQSLKLMGMLTGIISGRNQLAWLRFYNIAATWTQPTDVDVTKLDHDLAQNYRTVHLQADDSAGQPITKRIVFTKNTKKSSSDVHQEEADYERTNNKQIRIKYVNPDMLRASRSKIRFQTTPVPTDNDPISYMMFAKQLTDAQMMFGPQSLQAKKLKRLFAKKTGNDFDTWFKSEQELQQDQQNQPPQPAQGQPQQPGQPVPLGMTPKTTIGNAAKGAMPQMSAVMR